ncbi:hypothetical protein QE152_g40846, partial [Popillia japonica]
SLDGWIERNKKVGCGLWCKATGIVEINKIPLMAMEDDEMEQIATFMGHTKKTHAEFYRLPQDMYQTAKVAKIQVLRKAAHTETCNITPVSEGCSSTMQATSDDIPKESTSKRIEDNSRDKVKGIGFV